MTIREILSLKGWSGCELNCKFKETDVKVLEEKATIFHNTIEKANKTQTVGGYVIKTLIIGIEKYNDYILHVKINYYGSNKHEHKENSHRQKIYI